MTVDFATVPPPVQIQLVSKANQPFTVEFPSGVRLLDRGGHVLLSSGTLVSDSELRAMIYDWRSH